MVHLVLAAAVLIALIGRGKSKYIFAVACLVLFLFAGLRYMYGSDYPNYYGHYLNIRAGGESHFDEWLFTLLNQISPSFQFLIALTSAVFVYGAYRLIVSDLDTDYAWIGLLIFVVNPSLFLMNLSALRQCMALVAFIGAVHFGIRRKLLPYLLLIGVACLLHKSALILLPMWFLCGQKRVRWPLVCAVVLVFFLLMFVVDLNAIILLLLGIFDDAGYLHHATNGLQNSLRATMLTAISFVYVLGNLPRLEGKALVYGKLYLVSLMLGVLAYHMSMLTRVQMYFDIFSVAAIPAILRADQKRGPVRVRQENIPGTIWDILNRFALPALVFLVYGLRYYSFFTNESWSAFFVYRTIFSAK